MSKSSKTVKLLPLWIAVSAVFLIAGIVLLCLMNFNYSAEYAAGKTVEVRYGVVTQISEEQESKLKDACEKAFSDAGVSYLKTDVEDEVNESSLQKTVNKKIVYTFASGTNEAHLTTAAASIRTAMSGITDSSFSVGVHGYETQNSIYSESLWRGAIAIAVAAIVVLVYVGVRYGVGSALTGLVLSAHDAALTAALLAIFRIPTFFYAPLIYTATSALVSILFWMIECMKMKENFKLPDYADFSAEEAIASSRKTAWKFVILFAAGLAVAIVACGAVATGLSRIFFLPLLISVGVAVYSSLLLGPALHVPVKKAFDKWKAKRTQRRPSKKKTSSVAESET